MLMLIQAATTAPAAAPAAAQTADQEINTVLVITRVFGEVARTIDTALTPEMGTVHPITQAPITPKYAVFADYINVLFIVLALVAVISLLWDAANLIFDAGTGEHQHDYGLHRLLDFDFLKKAFKLAILLTLGVSTHRLIYSGTGAIVGVGPVKVSSAGARQMAGPLVTMMNPINMIVAPLPAPPAELDTSICGTIAKASAKLGAWHLSREAQDATARKQARNAAEQVWKEMHPPGTEPAGGAPGSSGSTAKPVTNKVLISNVFVWLGNALMASGTNMMLLFLNFGLDVMIARTLVFNAIYLMIGYKIAVLLLPIGFVAAYWHQWEGVIRGLIQVMIVTVISMNILSNMTTILVDPAAVTAMINDAAAQSLSKEKNAEMLKLAKHVYSMMTASGEPVSKEDYMAQVANDMGSTTNSVVFNLDATFWAPIRVFMLLTILVSLIGRIGTVVSDTISGTMSYHRG